MHGAVLLWYRWSIVVLLAPESRMHCNASSFSHGVHFRACWWLQHGAHHCHLEQLQEGNQVQYEVLGAIERLPCLTMCRLCGSTLYWNQEIDYEQINHNLVPFYYTTSSQVTHFRVQHLHSAQHFSSRTWICFLHISLSCIRATVS